MRIGVDIRGILTGRRSGVEQYALHILQNLLLIDKVNTYVLFYVSYRDLDAKFRQLLTEAPFLKAANVEVKTLKWVNFPLLLHALWKPFDWPKVDTICGGLDVMWLPSPRLLPLSQQCRRVITFHDLIFELFPQFYTWKSRLWQWQMGYAHLARIADNIIAISNSTKNDLVRLYHTDASKIQVVYEAADEIYFIQPSNEEILQTQKKFGIDSSYLYYVGSIEPRKNIISIVRGLQYLNSRPTSDKMKLVISGAKSWLSSELYAEVEKLNLKNQIIFTGAVTEQEKICLLNGATAFVFPTLYEGFGLPVLEAMATGLPVITSNNSSLPEVAGDSAILVDPLNQTEINSALEKVINDKYLAKSLADAGKVQAKKFSWKSSAEQTLNILKHVGN